MTETGKQLDSRTPRLHVEVDLTVGGQVALNRDQSHYLTRVLRLDTGASVLLFNGRDGEWIARIGQVQRGAATLSIEAQSRPQTDGPDLWLLFAPLKRAPIDFLAQKATELGVSTLMPVTTARTVVARVNRGRLTTTAIEAAEQSARLTVPYVAPLQPLAAVLADWPAGRRLMLCDETGGGEPIAKALSQAPRGAWALLTGPEGGFTSTELDGLCKLPFVTSVGLGPRILKAETAALAALACWQALLGDGDEHPRFRVAEIS